MGVIVGSLGDGVVAAVGGGVDGDDVGAVGEVTATENGELPIGFGQHGDGAALRGNVQATHAGVEREDVVGVADLLWVAGLVGVQVQGVQGGIAVASDEADPVVGVTTRPDHHPTDPDPPPSPRTKPRRARRP